MNGTFAAGAVAKAAEGRLSAHLEQIMLTLIVYVSDQPDVIMNFSE